MERILSNIGLPGAAPRSRVAKLALAAVAGCHTAFSQPAFEPVPTAESQRQIVERIQAIQSRDEVDAVSLIPPLTELALLHEQSGDHALAIAALERALQIIRVDRGVHSLDQAPLLRLAIRNEEARGDAAAGWDREQQLVELARRHPADLRTVPIFREVADRRMALFERWMAGEYPQQMVLGGYCAQLGRIFTCRRRLAARQVVADAQTYYAEAIEVILRNQLYSSEALRALEMELVRTSHLPAERPGLSGAKRRASSTRRRTRGVDEEERDPVAVALGRSPITTRLRRLAPDRATEQDPEPGERESESVAAQTYYSFGRGSLRRLYEYEVASAAPPLDQVRAFVRIADWDLLYSQNALALDGYEQVHEWLAETPGTQAWLDELFAPAVPVVLPAFAPNPLLSARSEDTSGHVDVAFRITRYGEARRVEILDTTMNADETATRCLVQRIRSSRFRPRAVDGELRVSPVVLRYYLNGVPPDDASPSRSSGCRAQLSEEQGDASASRSPGTDD